VSAHLTPRDIKSRLDHPLIGADGHWIEHGRVVHEQSLRIGGDAGACRERTDPRRGRIIFVIATSEATKQSQQGAACASEARLLRFARNDASG